MLYIDSNLLKRFGKAMKKGTVLCREGEEGAEHMYVIFSGKVGITKNLDGQEQLLKTLSEGDFFGEMSILNNEPRSATAIALTECKVLVIDSKGFEMMIRKSADLGLRLIRALADRLYDNTKLIGALLCQDDASRGIISLLNACEKGDKTERGVHITVDLKEFSGRINVSEDGIRAIMEKLSKAELVTEDPTGFLVSSPEKLEKFLQFLRDRSAAG
jgi:CRP/FNR family transcriptional regulator